MLQVFYNLMYVDNINLNHDALLSYFVLETEVSTRKLSKVFWRDFSPMIKLDKLTICRSQKR